MADGMKVRALAPWFGSKRTLAPEIVRQLGPHRAYWEPFCGSMAVLLAKLPSAMETVNDLHGDLFNLARVVRDPRLGPALYRRLRRTLAHKLLFDEAAARLHERGRQSAGESPDLQWAEDFFLASWLGRNGVSGTMSYNQGYCRRYTKSGGHAATRWRSAVDSIPAWSRRLRAVTILSEDGIDLLSRVQDAPGVAIYADPPYLVKGAKYVHDFEAEDHARLAAALRRFTRARVVVSYYDHPRLAELYPRWRKIHCAVNKALVNQGLRDRKGATAAPEVLLVNEPPSLFDLEAPGDV